MDSRIIVSLDFAAAASATGLVRQLGAEATFYKVGLQLLTAAGPSIVRELVAVSYTHLTLPTIYSV